MNEERFRELARQAGILIDWGEDIKVGRWGIGGKYENMQKFAELIMREFIGILEEEIKLVEEFKSTSVKADVIKCHTSKIYHFHKLIDKSKKHFGVEE